jgi:DNA-binding NarL/FixJ family response regulator
MRRSIVRLIATTWPNASVAEAGDLAEMEAAARIGGTISLVVLDPALRDANGLSALVAIQQRMPDAPVVIFSARGDDQIIASSRAFGALAYVHKSAGVDDVLEALRSAASGVPSFPPLNGARAAEHDFADLRKRLGQLTPTQLKVLINIADGRLNKQVAADMQVSEAAIKAHLTSIFRKLRVSNRTQALLALRPILANGPQGVAA